MAITNPTTQLALERQTAGANSNTWGDRANANFARVDSAFNVLEVDITAGNLTLTSVDSGDLAADAQTRPMCLSFVGTPAAAVTVTFAAGLPRRVYVLMNATAKTVSFKVGTNLSPVVLHSGERRQAFMDGTLVQFGESAELSDVTVLPDGKMLQWGFISTGPTGVTTWTFSRPFPIDCDNVQVTLYGTTASALSTFSAVNDRFSAQVGASNTMTGAAAPNVGCFLFAKGR